MDYIDPSHQIETKKLQKNTKIVFSENSRKILEKRYLRKDAEGIPAETIEGMFDRISRVVAEPARLYRDVEISTIEFYNILSTKKFFPNSPTFTGAGTPLGQLAACFVLPIEDDLGKKEDGIFSVLKKAALIQQVGGGNGFSFSRLRPRGSVVASSNGVATGPVGFMQVYDTAFGEVAQGGVRRGANMGVLRVDHPDIREFISCKTSEGSIANFNISVAVTDVFMQAVKNDTTYELINP
ncbi:ribonucleoside-diphosphate reductase, adenosylcobalamin-dependent, partial [bacterium]|nr:ribonucleoside-diphosphate reductase, adenosylcobalamin-dependent [bacterium]